MNPTESTLKAAGIPRPPRALTAPDFRAQKRKRPLSVVTSYDAWSARIVNATPIDAILVGDSVAMVVHGHPSTLHATLEMMALHVAAVARGAPDKFIIGDLPFLSFRLGVSETLRAAGKLMQAGAHAVKLEGVRGHEAAVHALVESGIPVMGHLGLTPQSMHALGGFRVQGRSDPAAQALIADARELERLGAFALVLECVPTSLARVLTEELAIPTIGIGAGAHTDGQVLVLQDLMGVSAGFQPKFVRRFGQLETQMHEALERFHHAVVEREFPSAEESYT